eukprot:TRINITY_DN10223_c0_g1_i4.p1 TRINITY_DN10223_c0_g1~~TRINITY_DN10223_c0_g1_i4.p1  ORF type:complete len:261 (-),score=66.40 TRINITY_DN10223_c0_g1_i4:150-932(-)
MCIRDRIKGGFSYLIMGNICSKSQNEESEDDLTYTYEIQCTEMEDKLHLKDVHIEDFEATLEVIAYKKGRIDYDGLAEVFERFYVKKEDFNAPQKPFLSLYNGLIGSLEEDKSYVLSITLPFCKGTLADKKHVLWRCLETTEKNYINYVELLGLIKMIATIAIKIIPEIVVRNDTGNKDTAIRKLLNASEDDLSDYTTRYFPKYSRGKTMMHKYEFDEWLEQTDARKIFSTSNHRQTFLAYLKKAKKLQLELYIDCNCYH